MQTFYWFFLKHVRQCWILNSRCMQTWLGHTAPGRQFGSNTVRFVRILLAKMVGAHGASIVC